MRIFLIAFLMLGFLGLQAASAQDTSVEDRLRDALRQATADLRAAQDSQTSLQAQVDQLTKQVAQLQAQAQQQPAQTQPVDDSGPLKQQIGALQQQNAQLQAGLQHWQAAYNQAATIARTKDQQAREETASSTAEQSQIKTCTQENTQLISTANSILDLYQTEKFRSLLLKSNEPLVGLWQVKLENIVQGYQEKINAQVYYPAQTSAPGVSMP
jgi:uncharacterized protein YlxW (UPF0749 family)